MKTYSLSVFIATLFFFNLSFSQEQELEVDLDILKEIQSPAATFVGISSTEISKPADPTAFMVSLRQATSNFSEIPLNYAIDIAPAWLLNGKKITAENFLSSNPKYSIPQSFVFSLAVNNDDIDIDADNVMRNTAFGIGLKFSFYRGEVSEKTLSAIAESIDLAKQRNKAFSVLVEEEQSNSTEWQNIINTPMDNLSEADIYALQLRGQLELEKINDIVNNKLENWQKEFDEVTEKLDFNRVGFKLDFSAAMAINFENQVYDSGKISKVGAWITGGYDWNLGLSVTGIVRYLYNPDEKFTNAMNVIIQDDISLFNTGLKVQYIKNKFSFSLEAIGQNAVGNKEVDSGIKYLMNTEYKIADNMKLSFTFGRDYDGMITKDGNVITALNLLVGLGSKRAISDDTSQ